MVHGTILVVEDDDLSRDLLRLLLTREGYTVEASASGEEALALLNNGATADVVLSDLQMPGLSGSALARSVRTTLHPPRVLLAMSGTEPDASQIDNFDGFLLKPFSMQALAEAIAQRAASADIAAATGADNDAPLVLDISTYEKLKASMKPEKLQQLYDLCIDDTTRRVASMRLSASAGDDDSYRREAHAIKGGCGMIGALELQSIAASEENSGITANHVATLDEILVAVERLKRMLVAQ